MRHLLMTAAACLMTTPALAARITADAPVTAVTLYPQGASVTRIARISPGPGRHEVIVPGMGENLNPSSLRVTAKGATIGAVSLQTAPAAVIDPPTSPEYKAARARFEELQAALERRDETVATIRARGQAASDSIDFMMKMAGSDNLAGQDLSQVLDLIGERINRARKTAISAETRARLAEQDRDRDIEALERARRTMDALAPPDVGQQALMVEVETMAEAAEISITSFEGMTGWQPVYDLRLDRGEGRLLLDRGFLVSQGTGEDWRDVALTLSTARPGQQNAPTTLTPWFPRLIDPPQAGMALSSRNLADMAVAEAAAPQAKGGLVAETRWMGATVVYDYPNPASIRSDADMLRLQLDRRELTPQIRATAVPQRDSSAFLVAEAVNTLDEVILPGQVTLYADGVMVGQDRLDLTPAGDIMRLGFGPIDGLTAEFEIPQQAEGDRGFLSKSNTSQQTTILHLRNLTGEDWDLRVVSQIPVPTQDDLKLSWSADPKPSGEDPDGQRGVIYWDQKIASEGQIDITLTTTLNWPDGKVLQGATAPGQHPVPIKGVLR